MRTIICVLDSAGCGALPDAIHYGDDQSNTLLHVLQLGSAKLPHLQSLGLGNILDLPGVPPTDEPEASYGMMMLASPGKDTITGHWELAGIRLERPFPLFPAGFPPDFIHRFEDSIGRKTLGNIAASGTEIIASLGEEHLLTGYPIVYTSADSVFQIAAHEETIPLPQLYSICQTARDMLQGGYRVGRVIARPFVGSPGSFQRTANRHDYAVLPPTPNLLTILTENGILVRGIGKIGDIFCQVGISSSHPTKSNQDGLEVLERLLYEDQAEGLFFLNLVDFDALYGHRNDPQGYARALEDFDSFLPRLLTALHPGDRLVITADHGCDPTTDGTDHSREYVPLLIYTPQKKGQPLGVRSSLADLAASECVLRQINLVLHGEPIEHY